MIYIMGDIHGRQDRFQEVMQQINLKKEDHLYVLGDVIDRYPDGLRILRDLLKRSNVTVLLGNHEHMMLEALNKDHPNNKYIERWYNNGGAVTHRAWKHCTKAYREEMLEAIKNLPLQCEVQVNGKKYLLVHGAPKGCFYKYNDDVMDSVWGRLEPYRAMPKGKTVREGCKIKPDVLEFGGNEESRFGTLNGNKGGAYCERQGTSFACPNLVRKIGKMMLLSEQVTPQLARALIIHKAQRRLEVEDERMIGNGLLLQDAEDILQCTDKAVDFYYQGKIREGSSLHVPIFVPNLNGYNGNVQITWTIVTVSSTNIGDCSAYTNNCLLETFYPNKYKYRFSKWVDGNEKTVIIDTSSAIGQSEATRLQREGYKISTMPVSKPPKMFHTEKELKKQDLKWDTVVKYSTTMRGSSLKDPAVVLQSIGREDGENEDLAYYMVVTVSIPKYPGDLYLDTCAQYQLLESIQIRNTAEIMVPVN